MSDHKWQKSSYSPDGANCVYVAASRTELKLHLRESDDPTAILTTTPASLRSLIRTLKSRSIANHL
ncbi:DUF397 domain-containing protein [Streptomyces phaeolivaceus]|uniref:DUF397 domain-containing protein n=1 Tax=Streptomyces phaeolivaceus TaxID=2653200 RepID=A0A5P8K3F4_9ACTN|nr:DUF397 domain-containing protein [Streptomyces phaeolivaceus]QFQ97823.1 DUF397 domain-containing protein [Streptomyces phaeolivaceus]